MVSSVSSKFFFQHISNYWFLIENENTFVKNRKPAMKAGMDDEGGQTFGLWFLNFSNIDIDTYANNISCAIWIIIRRYKTLGNTITPRLCNFVWNIKQQSYRPCRVQPTENIENRIVPCPLIWTLQGNLELPSQECRKHHLKYQNPTYLSMKHPNYLNSWF